MNVSVSSFARRAAQRGARGTPSRVLAVLLMGATCSAHVTWTTNARAQARAAAPASGPRDRARELGDRGLAAYDKGDYAKAHELFRLALELYDFPTLRLYLARSLSKQSRPVAASEAYAELLARPVQPDEGEGGARARAAAALERVETEARRPRLTLSSAGEVPGVRVDVDGLSRAELVLGRDMFLEPGTHQIRATHPDGRTWVRAIALSEGQVEQAAIEWGPAPLVSLAPAAPASASAPAALPSTRDTPPPARSSVNTPAWVAGVITGVLLGGTIVTGIIAAGRKSDYDDANESGDVSDERKRDLRDEAYDMQLANAGLAAGTLLGASATLYFVLRAPDTETGAAGATASASPSPAGWQLGVRGTF